ncbi:hypothetical protein N7507_007368 [Penicillium longicatenatum]|nr:hypothetical protein N7507_007368 [Penicillium longicatenatum]
MSDDPAKRYADIMGYKPHGHFLYKPLDANKIPLGSVGYFHRTGDWCELVNLMDKGNPEAKGYKPFRHSLEVDKVQECYWDKQSGESEVGRSSRATAEASGAMAAAPIDVSAQMKHKTSSTGSAALITGSVVRYYKLKDPFKFQIMDWVDENGAEFIKSRRQRHEIRERGLFVIMAIWVTDECAVKLTTGESSEVDLSLDLGATGIGKIGGGIGAFDKLKREDWRTYTPKQVIEDCFPLATRHQYWDSIVNTGQAENGHVVSFAGVEYSLKFLAKKRTVVCAFFLWDACCGNELIETNQPVEISQMTISLKAPKPKLENTTTIKDGTLIEQTAGEDKTAESETDSEEEDAGESVCKVIGIDDSDDEAEKENVKQQESAKIRLMEKLVQIRQIENEEQKKEELSKFLKEDPQAAAATTMQ